MLVFIAPDGSDQNRKHGEDVPRDGGFLEAGGADIAEPLLEDFPVHEPTRGGERHDISPASETAVGHDDGDVKQFDEVVDLVEIDVCAVVEGATVVPPPHPSCFHAFAFDRSWGTDSRA